MRNPLSVDSWRVSQSGNGPAEMLMLALALLKKILVVLISLRQELQLVM